MIRLLLTSLLLSPLLFAEEANDAAAPAKPVIKDLGDGKFEVGLVTFNRDTREIRFDTEVNMREGPLEYVIVHQNGKIHEAILITKARPFHINIALKVLDYKESKELFPILDEEYRPAGKFPDVPEAVKNAARAEILLQWKDGEKERRASLNDWVTYTVSGKPLPPLPWVYGGSYIHNNSFQAEASGDIVALFTSNASLFNWPGKDGSLDDVWLPNTPRIPQVGTPVEVIIKPFVKQAKGDPAASPPAQGVPDQAPKVDPDARPRPLPLPKPKNQKKDSGADTL